MSKKRIATRQRQLALRSIRRNLARKAKDLRYWRLADRVIITHRVKIDTEADGTPIFETHNQETVPYAPHT